MKRKSIQRWIAVLCIAVLCSAWASVGAAADGGLVICADAGTLHLPLAAIYTPQYSAVPDGVAQAELLVSFSNSSIIRRVVHEADVEYQMVGAGQTVMTVKTPDGRYSDSLSIVAEPAIPMPGNGHTTVYTNTQYQSRTFTYTPARSGTYELTFSLPHASLHFTEVYDANFERIGTPSGDKTIELVGGKTYYLRPMADGDIVGNSYDFCVKYLGTSVERPTPSSVQLARNEITMMLGDIAAIPSYTFEPGGWEWYDSVVYTSDNDDVLYIDYDENAMEALSPGTATLTVTSETWGWSDTVHITVVDAERELNVDEPLSLTIYDGEYKTAFFTAPRTARYTFYSVTEGEGDPVAGVFDEQSGDSIAVGDDENGTEFVMSAELYRGQRVELLVAGYTEELHTTLYVGFTTAATSVELYLPEALSQNGDLYYVRRGDVNEPLVRFRGELTAEPEEYEITADFYDGAKRDGNGGYWIHTGQAVRFTVTTDSGLTDTVMVMAIDLLAGDLDLDGAVDAIDAATAFYTLNGLLEADAATLGAMELTGDNRITLADAARLFYYVNGLVEIV